jgi:hypothetical protein
MLCGIPFCIAASAVLHESVGELFHMLVVGVFPVDAITGRAELKFLEQHFDLRRQPVSHCFLLYLTQDCVALNTPREWQERTIEIEAVEDFGQLEPWITFPDAVLSRNLLPLDKTSILAQQCALFFPGPCHKGGIVGDCAERRIESEHAQMIRKLTEMNIQHEARFPQGFVSYLGYSRDVE